MRVVLPGEPDASVNLNVQLCVVHGRTERQMGRHGRDQVELVERVTGGPSRVPHGGGGQLGGDEHVGAMVLHGLEGADGAAELHAFLRVGDGRLGAGRQDAHRLRGAQRAGQGPSPPGGTGHHVGVGHAHRGQRSLRPTGGTDRGPCSSPTSTPCRSRAHQHHVVTQAEQQEVGRSPSQDDARLPVEQAVGQGQRPAQSDRAGDRAIRQSGKQRRLQLGPLHTGPPARRPAPWAGRARAPPGGRSPRARRSAR